MKKLTTDNLNVITDKIIKCAIEVHKNLGPGLLESIYEKAMCYELSTEDINFSNQVIIPITYKGTSLGEHRLDFLVESEVIVEFKAVDRMDPVFKAQVLSYLRLTGKKLGLLINFNVPVLKDGIQRVIL
jgi:GxxExxY protein